ncbi:hypothetical protein GGS26DRAFT_602471 [Hypomontagnella submonticulosa]|nr:hypothetical protein GGS26DRAFT_602471 [Hypomontagnella submonticulosa]
MEMSVNITKQTVPATSNYQTCFKIDGTVQEDSFRCDNGTIGHSACCSQGEVCWSNGVCHVINNGAEDWLREGCTDPTWEDLACFDVCPWFLGRPIDGRRAVGVRPCDGIDIGIRYCCDNGTTGLGSFACCNDESQIFQYNNLTVLPTILATIPVRENLAITTATIPNNATIANETPRPTSEMSTPINATSTGSASPATDSNNSTTSIALGAGLGAGLPVAAIIIGGIWFVISRSKQKQQRNERQLQQGGLDETTLGPPAQLIPHELPPDDVKPELSSGYEIRELPA